MVKIANVNKRAESAGGVRPVESYVQLTLPAGADFEAGDACFIDGTSGRFVKSGGTYYGLAAKKAKTGFGLTAIRQGIFDGLDVSGLNYGAKVYTSATAGRVADASASGQAEIGFVVPGTGNKPFDKLVYVEGGGAVAS